MSLTWIIFDFEVPGDSQVGGFFPSIDLESLNGGAFGISTIESRKKSQV
jgi:hypothetical protein